MADKKISDYTATTATDIGDLEEIETAAGNSRKRRAGVSGTASGTAFPGSPTTGDRFWRSDLGREYFHDGTRWLSVTLYHKSIGAQMAAVASTSTLGLVANPGAGSFDIYVIDVLFSYVLTGTGNWTLICYSQDGASTNTFATAANLTTTTWASQRISVNAVQASTIEAFATQGTENSGTATFFGLADMQYRIVG